MVSNTYIILTCSLAIQILKDPGNGDHSWALLVAGNWRQCSLRVCFPQCKPYALACPTARALYFCFILPKIRCESQSRGHWKYSRSEEALPGTLLSTAQPDLWKPYSLGIAPTEFTRAGNFSSASDNYSTFIPTRALLQSREAGCRGRHNASEIKATATIHKVSMPNNEVQKNEVGRNGFQGGKCLCQLVTNKRVPPFQNRQLT